TTAGVSHGPGYLCIIDGCPAGLELSVEDLLPDLARRRPGQSKLTTQRDESDAPELWSGVFEGKTDGTPIGILFRNTDQRSGDYGDIKDKYRPGHADYTFDAKYGFRDYRGGGRSSARETVCRVAAGAVAKKLLAREGARVLGKLKADLGKALLSLPAVLGFEYGAGFAVAGMRGSENNDAFVPDPASHESPVAPDAAADCNAAVWEPHRPPRIRTATNRHGG